MAILPLLLASATAGADPGPAPAEPISHRRHVVGVAGGPLAYVSDAGRLTVRDGAGIARGSLFFVSYRVASRRPRPVTFVWNGGPGGNALPLHIEFAGPRRLTARGFVDNAQTLLAHSDLVFLDPQSTGYSRAASDADAAGFYDTLADQRWTAAFITEWRDRFAAHRAPLFLMGESFGVPRATGTAEILLRRGIPVKGLMLISGGRLSVETTLPPALSAALYTPNKAMAAFFHHKVAGTSAPDVRRATARWARAAYAPAMEAAASLPADARRRAAQDVAARLGVPVSIVDPATLTLTTNAFTRALMAPARLQPYDMRRLARTEDDADVAEGRRIAVIRAYLTGELGYRTPLSYWGLESGQPPVNARWTYAGDAASMQQANDGGGPPESTPWISRILAISPRLRIIDAIGRYDSQNSCEATDALIRRLGRAEARAITLRCYAGGHMMYRDEPARRALSRDVARFVRENARP